jgi:succinyl-CoA synthetase beta subunit
MVIHLIICKPIDFAGLRDTCSDYLFTGLEQEVLSMKYLPDSVLSNTETAIRELDSRTGGSLKFTLLNPNGDIWTLIAGGGASVVYTDAIINSGNGDRLANYGEYSGDPQEELVYEYCVNVFSLMSQVNKQKILLSVVVSLISQMSRRLLTGLSKHSERHLAII